MAQEIDIGKEFSRTLNKQNCKLFFDTYLKPLDDQHWWCFCNIPYIVLNFENVSRISPSFAHYIFNPFVKCATMENVLNIIVLKNITPLKLAIIKEELHQIGFLCKK